jgi:hypothetical protein
VRCKVPFAQEQLEQFAHFDPFVHVPQSAPESIQHGAHDITVAPFRVPHDSEKGLDHLRRHVAQLVDLFCGCTKSFSDLSVELAPSNTE